MMCVPKYEALPELSSVWMCVYVCECVYLCQTTLVFRALHFTCWYGVSVKGLHARGAEFCIARVCVCLRTCVLVCSYVNVYVICVCVCVCVCVCMCALVFVHACVYMCLYTVYIYICVCIYEKCCAQAMPNPLPVFSIN
jgi:hypothetical protein